MAGKAREHIYTYVNLRKLVQLSCFRKSPSNNFDSSFFPSHWKVRQRLHSFHFNSIAHWSKIKKEFLKKFFPTGRTILWLSGKRTNLWVLKLVQGFITLLSTSAYEWKMLYFISILSTSNSILMFNMKN